ncbi:MAG: NAD-binding protein, partial [Pseudomonadota bacterium]
SIPDVSGHVVVIGFGRVGQLLGEVFDQQRVPYVAVEHNIDRVAKLRAEGKPIYYGNAGRPELLYKLGLDKAASLVVTMDQPMAAMRVVHNARLQYPNLPIYARSHDEKHAQELRRVGATFVVPETLEAGLLLTTFALGSLGLTDNDVRDIVDAERDRRVAYAT